ncbi:MAG: glutathione peroxidase [Phycisphaerales bacterium]
MNAGVWAAIFTPIFIMLFPNASREPEEKASMNQPAALASAATPEEMADPRFVLGYTMPMLDGEPKDLHEFKGKVVLIVNTASLCGYTRQYAGLEKLYEENKDKGLVILGFPANNFHAQEPGSDSEIAAFCDTQYSITFPMFSKISVRGDDTHPLYQRLAKIKIEEVDGEEGKLGGPPNWNFTKFLVDCKGRLVARYASKVEPDDERLIEKIHQLLDAKD